MSQIPFTNSANAGTLSNDICSRLPWPICTIDFEASSLEVGNFPIEVGLAIWRAPEEPIYRWSALLQPTDQWRQNGHWSKASQAVHGIKQGDLSLGVSPRMQLLFSIMLLAEQESRSVTVAFLIGIGRRCFSKLQRSRRRLASAISGLSSVISMPSPPPA
jgi:hypothetical protein